MVTPRATIDLPAIKKRAKKRRCTLTRNSDDTWTLYRDGRTMVAVLSHVPLGEIVARLDLWDASDKPEKN